MFTFFNLLPARDFYTNNIIILNSEYAESRSPPANYTTSSVGKCFVMEIAALSSPVPLKCECNRV